MPSYSFSSVLISYSHTYNPALKKSPLSIVTALVDKIGKIFLHMLHNRTISFVSFHRETCKLFLLCGSDMRQHVIYPDCDIKFTGNVTWVGRTSIEAKMHMSQVGTFILTTAYILKHMDDSVSSSSTLMEPIPPLWTLRSSW